MVSAPAAPFDRVAERYDRDFTERPLGRLLRGAVHAELDRLFAPGDHVLELGCGTGEDAVHLSRRGARVTAVDVSQRMLDVAAAKARAAGVQEQVRLVRADLAGEAPFGAAGEKAFDGAFSSFGALNCLENRRQLLGALAGRLRPGAPVVLVLMGPLCPWEVAWHLLRLSPRTALRRLKPGGVEARLGDPPLALRVRYPAARRLRREAAPWFEHRRTVGIGVALPPPYLGRLVEGRPRLGARLAAWDRRLGPRLVGRWLNDHYLLELVRR